MIDGGNVGANALGSGDSIAPNGEELAKLEKEYARAGQDDLARKTRLRRVETDVQQAESVLAGGNSNPREMLKLAKRLAGYKLIGLARRILKRARLHPPLNRTIW